MHKYDKIASIWTEQSKAGLERRNVRAYDRAWKIENLRARFFVYVKLCLRTRRVHYYFVYVKIAYVYVCRQSVYLRYSSFYECTQLVLHILEIARSNLFFLLFTVISF